MKYFEQELFRFLNKIKSKENFALVRFGDGEMRAMEGEEFVSGYGEWRTKSPDTDAVVDLLRQSFVYKDDEYYVGIVCPCCQGEKNHLKMKNISGQNESQLTFANVFVNSNWKIFCENLPVVVNNRRINLITHINSKENLFLLPFSGNCFLINDNAWVVDHPHCLNLLRNVTSKEENEIFLISAGPYANILIHQLWQENKNNTYIDIGSALSYWLKSDFHNPRIFYNENSSHYNFVCRWL